MIGFVRRQEGARGHGLPLEVTALMLEEEGMRIVLCGVDTLGIPEEEADGLRRRLARAVAADPTGVLLNWNHTHSAPPASSTLLRRSGLLALEADGRIDGYAGFVADRVVACVERAADRLEPAGIAWGTGAVDISVNRRERGPDGQIVHGWRADGLLDRQVVVLQARRRDGSVVCTLVGYGCHTVSVGMDVQTTSSDFPGPLRRRLREWTGGEAVFFQGAAGNVLPRIAFCEDEREAERMGTRLALEAMHAVADRSAWPERLVARSDGSLIPMILFRYEELPPAHVALAAASQRVDFPLLAAPTRDELIALCEEYEAAVADAESRGAGPAERYGLLYHLKWARLARDELARGAAPATVSGSLHAVRIGHGVIVTAPGEVFTEIGMAVKERSPGRPTLYAGYTNGAVGYFPTASAYAEGGYEPAYSNRSYGRIAPVAPECERLLVERGVRLAESLFPEAEPFSGDAWAATGAVPQLVDEPVERPLEQEFAPPPTARPPG
jgi:hypothetical protein